MNTQTASVDELVATLTAALDVHGIVLDLEERRAVSADMYSRGATCAALLGPGTSMPLRWPSAPARVWATRSCHAGGGLTYTGGYTPPHEQLGRARYRRLNRIVEIATTTCTSRSRPASPGSSCTRRSRHAACGCRSSARSPAPARPSVQAWRTARSSSARPATARPPTARSASRSRWPTAPS